MTDVAPATAPIRLMDVNRRYNNERWLGSCSLLSNDTPEQHMNVETIYLLGLDVWQATDSLQGLDEYLATVGGSDTQSSSVSTYRPDGAWARSEEIIKIDSHVPEFWQCDVNSTHLFHVQSIEEYIIRRCIVVVSPGALPEIVKLDRILYDQHCDSLFQCIFPQWQGERVGSTAVGPRFLSILYLEVDCPSAGADDDPANNVRHFAEAVRSLLHQDTACLPHILFDTLLLNGLGSGWLDQDVVAVGLGKNPLKVAKGSLTLPRTVMDLAQYMACIQILKHLGKRLQRLPFWALTLDQYIENITKLKELSGPANSNPSMLRAFRTRRNSNKDLSDAYEFQFLRDRQEVVTARARIMQAVAAIPHKLAENYLLRNRDMGGSTSVDTVTVGPSTFPYRYRFLDNLVSIYDGAISEARRIEGLIASRETILADYLRDATLAAATRSNLQLQYSIRRLTIVAVAIALIGLITAVLPDALRKSLYDMIVRLIH